MPVPDPSVLASVLRHVDANLVSSRNNLFALLRIPSISAQPAHAADCLLAAEWWQRPPFRPRLRNAESGRPRDIRSWLVITLARRLQGPHILFYGHYDVQPVDPLRSGAAPRSSLN